MRVAACILVGGQGTRMGGAVKPLLEWRGRAIIERTLDVLTPRFSELTLVGGEPATFRHLSCPHLPDEREHAGPLAGLAAALSWCSGTHLFAFAGDMPSLSGEVVDYMLAELHENPELALMVLRDDQGRFQPLHALYSVALVGQAQGALERGELALQRFVSGVEGEKRVLPLEHLPESARDGQFLRNVNHASDLD